MNIRTVRPSDLEEINRLLSESTGPPPGMPGADDTAAPLRSPELMQLRYEGHKEGAFVAEDGDRIAGAAFTRLWGRSGWIGPLVVESRAQGNGVGTRLLEEAVESLKKEGVTVLGTEIPLPSSRGIGFLSRRGFRPSPPTLLLERGIDEEDAPPRDIEPVYFSSLLEGDRGQFLEDVRQLSTSLDADLDYGQEVELVEAHRMGDSLLLRREEAPVGLAVCHTRPHTREGENDTLRVQVLCLDETNPFPSLPSVLGAVGLLARESRARRILLPLPSRCWEGLRLLTDQGYRVAGSRLRMTLLGYPERGDASRINLAAWS